MFFSACSTVWGQSRDEIMHALETHDYSLFDAIEPDRYKEALKLDDEAPFYIGMHLAQSGRTEKAIRMFGVGVSFSPEPYSSLCLKELSSLGTPDQRLAAVEKLLERQPDSAELAELRLRLCLITGKGDDIAGSASKWILAPLYDDAVIAAIDGGSAGLSKSDRDVFAVRTKVFRKDYGTAWADSKVLIESGATIWNRAVLSDMGKAALYGSTTPLSDAALFMALPIPPRVVKRDPSLRFLPVFYAGRLYDRAGKGAKARNAFLNAFSIADTAKDRDSALWYLWDTDLTVGIDRFIDDFEKYASSWNDPVWFADILETAIVKTVQQRDWAGLDRVRRALPPNADGELRARLDYLAARTIYANTADASTLLVGSYASDNASFYYCVMAASVMGTDIPPHLEETPATVHGDGEKKGDENSGAGGGAPVPEDPRLTVIRGYIDWYLPECVYPAAVAMGSEFTVTSAETFSTELEKKGRYGDAIRLVSFALHGQRIPVSRNVLELLYPRPWKDEIAAASARFGVPEYLLYALIRSESLFQPSVVSGAGAQGLSQLMRSTAVDIAKKLGQESFDLSDPSTNIGFGAYYLSELTGRLDGKYLPAFFAYNAGITRVREWIKSANGLPPDLMLESLPYSETREYGRKILAAAAMYGTLYYGKTSADIVREIFLF